MQNFRVFSPSVVVFSLSRGVSTAQSVTPECAAAGKFNVKNAPGASLLARPGPAVARAMTTSAVDFFFFVNVFLPIPSPMSTGDIL